MGAYFNPFTIAILLVNLALAYHCVRNGLSPLWLMAMAIVTFMGSLFAILALWGAYLFFAILPGFMGSHGMRRFRAGVADAADPGRNYRQKKRDVERVGSAESKRALAEECIRMGRYHDAVQLYEGAMEGPLGQNDTTLLKGLARAKLLAGDPGASEGLYLRLKALDPAAFDSECELDYARALEEQGKTDAALQQYEIVAPRYPGEEARVRFALLLEKLGQDARAQSLFREAVEAAKDAPGYYRARQGEWVRIARQHLK